MARGILKEPEEKTCTYCKDTFIQRYTRGSEFCSLNCKHFYKLDSEPDYRFKRILSGARSRAKQKALPFNLTLQYLKDLYEDQEGLCALTNTPFSFQPHSTKHVANKDTLSIDRIEPDLGYTKDNIRFVTFQVNCAKGYYTDEEFFEMCSKALRNRI